MHAAVAAIALAPGIAAIKAQAAYPNNAPLPTETVISWVVSPIIIPPLIEIPFSRLHPELPVNHGVSCQLEQNPNHR